MIDHRMQIKIKICCIKTIAEAKMAIDLGASAIGLVSQMPSGPGIIDDNQIKAINSSIPNHISTFLLTSNTNAAEIIKQLRDMGTNTVQIVDRINNAEYNKIRNALPKIKIVQVIHVIDHNSVKEAITLAPYVDEILLDSGNPQLKTKILGGTGKTHNWTLSKTIREAISIPVWLAGGLNPQNIKAAIEMVRPYGVDVCSGVRTDGNLDIDKLNFFVNKIKTQKN